MLHSVALRRAALLALLVLAIAGMWFSSGLQAADEGWTDNMPQAMKRAAAEKKDMLIDFTGSDWCTWCIRLREEVFEKDPFKSEAPKKFVLVELDFPNDKSKLSEETIKQNDEWQTRLGVEGFPTVFLTDEKGVPYAQTGYQRGGPEPYLTHLAELAEVRVKRDTALAKADGMKGLARAKQLDEALSVLDQNLAVGHYEPLVKEIVALDDENKAGLKDKYAGLLSAQAIRKMVASIEREFDGENGAEMIKRINTALTEHKPTGEALLQLQMMKSQMLQATNQGEEAVKVLDELIAHKEVEGRTRLQCMLQKAMLQAELKKIDDSVKTFDQLLAEDESPLRVRVMVMKAQMLLDADRKEDASATFDAAAEATDDEDLKKQILDLKADALGEKKPPAKKPSDEK